MIHFVPPHNEKVRAKAGELAGQVDVVLGNLEDAIPIESKIAARDGLIAMAKATDFGSTGLWARVNALNSPWFLDDMTRLVGEIGDKLDVVMVPKVEGDWDIHFVDQYLALLEARHGLKKPILVHAILETAAGRQQRRGDRRRLAAHAWHEPRAGRPRRLARDEDDPGRRRPSRLPGARRRDDARRARAPSAQQDPWHYTIARMVDACAANGIKAFYGPFGDFSDPDACEAQFRNAFLLGCAGAWTLHPSQIAIAKRVFSPDPGEVAFARKILDGDARRLGRGDDRRQDAGRRDLEAGARHRRPCQAGGGEGPGIRQRFIGSELTATLHGTQSRIDAVPCAV